MLSKIVCALLIVPAASQACQCTSTTSTSATTTTTTTGCPAGSFAMRPVDLNSQDDAALCSTTTTTMTTSTVTTSTVTTSTATTSTVTTSTATTSTVTTSTATTSTSTTTTCTCTTTAVPTATTSTMTTSTVTTSTQTTSTKTTSTVTTSTVTTSTVTTLAGCSGNRCRVCRNPTFSDTNNMSHHITGTLHFGPSQVENAIDEGKVDEYQVVFADACGNQVGTWSGTVTKSATAYSCCEPMAYHYTFSDERIPQGASYLAVLVKGSDGSLGGMWSIAINDEDTVPDDGHDHGTPKATTDTSGSRVAGFGAATLAAATLLAFA